MRCLKSLPGLLFFCAEVMLMVTACAWIPEGDKPAEFIAPPTLTHALSDIPHNESASARQHWPKPGWWHEFGSDELNSLMTIALKNNPNLKVAAARLREATALVRVEGARLLPFLDADAEFSNERISENGVFAVLNRQEAAGANIVFAQINPFNFRYEFDFWGKNRAALEAAIGEAGSEQAEWAETRLQLTSAIARSYLRGAALHQQLDLARKIVELQHELLILAETRLQLGLDSEDPVKQVNIALEAANKREAGVRDQLDLQRNLLARLIGGGPDSTHHLFTDTLSISKALQLPAKLPLELLAHRPDLASALRRAEAAAQRIKVAKARFLPTIDLTAFAGINALRLTKGANSLANILFSGSSFSYGVAPGLRLPWFEGGRLRGELSAQRAEYDGAVELYNDTLLHAVQEVADSLSSWKESRTILEAQERLLSSQLRNHELAADRFRLGLDDRRLMLRRQNTVFDQEFALKSLQADHWVARVDLIEALGGGYANDLQLVQQKIKHPPEHPGGFSLYPWLMFWSSPANEN
ncbi:MAG: histidine kinase [Gammaproteobacteria bacterium HGW-Gammaproteobacteria-3]|nr:MAG: histidine kinase [Gammaproteobacteria bacterium HGW-Gammaproteobacteria-3]